ncbi:unknown [Clostridium sp. CAG:921]|nr:unknown [Clostridium sp. CAG:921]
MLVDEGDELVVGSSEYIVLKKYTADNKEYIFVADSRAPDINIADNFDPEAIKLLMLSQDVKEDISNETVDNTSATNNNSFNLPLQNSGVQEMAEAKSIIEKDNLKINKEKSSGVLNVEKDQSLIEKILTFMFMG